MEEKLRMVTESELDELRAKQEEEEAKRVVVCNRCLKVLYEGDEEGLAKLADSHGIATFTCDNAEYVDPRGPRIEYVRNEDGALEQVGIERPNGCKNVVTARVKV